MYNVEKYIERCIISCEEQDIDKSEFELIVVNDGSKDNSLELAENLEIKYSNIHVYSQENAGLSAARNFGIKRAIGDYIWFVDSDDWVKTNCLKYLKERILQEPIDVAVLKAVDVFEEGERLYYDLDDMKYMTGPEALLAMEFPCAPFHIWKRSFLIDNNLEFFKGIFHEDMEFTPRALYQANRVMTIADVFYYVYQNPNSITRSVNPKKSFDYICHVCDSLYAFSRTVSPECKIKLYYFIGMCLNNALENIMDANDKMQDEVIAAIRDRKYLLMALRESKFLKYQLEYVLFKLAPLNVLTIYKLLHKIVY